MEDDLKRAVEFHGHMCPGLAIGYRVAKYVMNHYRRSEDEELVAVVENNSCSVDAIQEMLGCTFGKGNLIFVDNGKQVFTFYHRGDGKAIRIYFRDEILQEIFSTGRGEEARSKAMEAILSAPEENILSVREVDIPEPPRARIYPSIRCQECGESFMEIRGRVVNGKIVCKECFSRLT
ncbi:MAG: FmdE family protein [Methanothrix sp.]|jgi:formylmethanofuran dehydrogenase subunit E|uniref:FmdE family protein n=1 Tax=Methanothrix sp. TaxID=90426 RepID=UPI00247D3443|nr:FmdE family protein [Methanothrix sp.]